MLARCTALQLFRRLPVLHATETAHIPAYWKYWKSNESSWHQRWIRLFTRVSGAVLVVRFFANVRPVSGKKSDGNPVLVAANRPTDPLRAVVS
eukprot:CAMPEP_0174308150 /NCGR_PEP_ID=MMETSP0810-20121108/1565_1 /TAXON_ID=73025 ORGANISM="Eutreptiella gymnastica-like, Strain CCMP1594" /NCGR_SAMPLE_ID=MMETSP0810 /ASSEMBLY_ACC=CAM_ASM_000659 /LENGTH=92 /DNA_ID=CAMNT_0015415381 /DNA_START=597 /DNA_END=871 /DNA_ORIENTATION=+